MLKHIAQLKPIFTEFEDVIDVVNAGFIGVWGIYLFFILTSESKHLDVILLHFYDGLISLSVSVSLEGDRMGWWVSG